VCAIRTDASMRGTVWKSQSPVIVVSLIFSTNGLQGGSVASARAARLTRLQGGAPLLDELAGPVRALQR
jgi:hypothetical protein